MHFSLHEMTLKMNFCNVMEIIQEMSRQTCQIVCRQLLVETLVELDLA